MFEGGAPMKLTIEGDFSAFMFAQIANPEEWQRPLPADYRYPEGEITLRSDEKPSDRVTFTAKRVFGNFGKTCRFPKLKIVAKSPAPAGSLFAGVKELYVSLPCQTESKSMSDTPFGRTLDQEKSDMASEVLMYKSLLALGVPGIESRRVEFTFSHRSSKNASGSLETTTLPGILLESVSDVAERAGAETTLEWHASKSKSENLKTLEKYPIPTMGKLYYDLATSLWQIGDNAVRVQTNSRGLRSRLGAMWNSIFIFLKEDRGFFGIIDLDSETIRGWLERKDYSYGTHSAPAIDETAFSSRHVRHVCALVQNIQESEKKQDWAAFAATYASFDEGVSKNFPLLISGLKEHLNAKSATLGCDKYSPNKADGG